MEINYAQLAVNSLMLGLIYALIAFGFTLIFGIAGIINFAHGEIYMVGALVTFYMISALGLPIPLGIAVTALIMASIGAILNYVLFRRVRPQGKSLEQIFPPMIVSIALVSIIPSVAILLAGTREKAVPPYVTGLLDIGGVMIAKERLLVMVLALVVFVGLLFFIWKHREGRALAAMAQDIDAAKLNGVNLLKSDTIGFSIGFGLAAVAAALLAPIYYVDPSIGAPILLKTFIVVILGGIGSIPGTILGGLIVGFIEGYGQALLPGNMPTLLTFSLVVLILLIRPKGLLGHD